MRGAGQGQGPSRSDHLATDEHPACGEMAFHLSPWLLWQEARTGPALVPEGFAAEGFVHLTLGLDRLLVPANAYYREDPRPHVALTVDLAALTDEVRFDAEPEVYPHLYGPLPIAAVREVRPARRDPDGTFTGWGPPEAL